MHKSINFGGGSLYGSMNPNKSILTQGIGASTLGTTQFYAKNPEAINVGTFAIESFH
jgi:hypothetical protein